MIDKKLLLEKFPFPLQNETARNTVCCIVDEFIKDEGYTYSAELAYVLATAYHESAHTFNPGIREIGQGKGKLYGKADPSTGKCYYGRGLVQLTWLANYKTFSDILGQDLVNDPDLALEPSNSVKILMTGMRAGLFTGNKLRMYLNGVKTDYEHARRTVNGMDKAGLIAGYARKLVKIIEEAKIPDPE